VLGGFSQGAMLSLDVALRTSRPLAGLVLMSSTLIAAGEWTPLFPTRRGLSVLESHGRDDPLLPFALAELLRDLLRHAGLEITWVPFRGGHAIPDVVLDALSAFLRAVLTV
jgi:phospholipase/carboxylesterase